MKRFFYYSDPVLSAWARHDPNKPAPQVEQPRPVAAPAVAVAPGPGKSPQAEAAERAVAAASDAASKFTGFLKRKLDEKLGGS